MPSSVSGPGAVPCDQVPHVGNPARRVTCLLHMEQQVALSNRGFLERDVLHIERNTRG